MYLANDEAEAAKPASSTAPPSADATEAATAAQDEILVTGHVQRGAVATNVPPEVSLNSAVIQSLGAADLTEVFRELAPEIGATPGTSGAQRGPAIVLVNGQRIAGFSSIKDFPPESVRRIEIYPELVALQYGYGPDQRVVNVVLRDDYRALTLLGRYTMAPNNWRGLYRAKVDLIRIGENAHWNLALDYSHQDPIVADTTFAGSLAHIGATPRHTLAPQDDHLTISGASTRPIGAISAELTGSLDLDALQSRPGLLSEDADLLVQEGLADLATGPLDRVDRTARAQTSLTLNGKLDGWRWSTIAKLDESTRLTRTIDASSAAALDTILLPSPTMLGERCNGASNTDCASTTSRLASGDAYLNGNLFALPAGAVTAALRTGFVFANVRGDSALQSTDLHRSDISAQASLDFPITSRKFALGTLSTGVNAEVHRLSDFDTLSTIGSTLNWSPIVPVNIIASFNRIEQAPSLLQLGTARLVTPDLREFDFATGTTVIAQQIEGGNQNLRLSTSRIAKVRLQARPIAAADLTLSADYTWDHTRDPIMSITAATSATIAAFPDRFTRQNGFLTELDARPMNLDWRKRQQVRLGINYSTAFGGAWPDRNAAPASGTKPTVRDQFQIALYDTWALQDRVALKAGLPVIDLLGGDTLSDGGGTATHRLELQTTISTHAVSADVSGVWQTPTTTTTSSGEALTFSQGITLNLRVQINLADQAWLRRRIPWLKGNLNLSADNLLGAHTTVHDARGVVPLAYSESYLNPTGRTFRITLRKRFR
ncbi:porin family protein [Sphingomonas nostoxanthinifaciens]|uniref:hypothetical protein n=1 Tax=Sphingomonas nostoxanthinifaciens TaxID=2872652 RepID=UPI001CC21BE7|nr:hypothetical protein [Sphingomonas nostoxanthinifaciens]UAK25821.1 hypothetical protein K8P63_06740 [Sphingomonas nostoxanthinifaciens]